jgi:hypothetical protein
LDTLEKETNTLCTISVKKFNYMTKYGERNFISDFQTRKLKIEVYDMHDLYKALEGIYESQLDVINKIESFKNDEHWNCVIINLNSPNILRTDGSRYQFCTKIGKYRFC